MKTITFYSYKGGTGRTLALANLAVCLSRLGKNVCVLDFDFEAPSLHHKFANSFEEVRVEWGALDYIWKYIESGYRNPPDSIIPYTSKIKIGDLENNGVIHLIPAGNVQSIEYKQRIASSKWHKAFRLMPEESEYAPTNLDDIPSKNMSLFLQIKESILRLEPKPDYLLVDSRTGIVEGAGACTWLWADIIVYLLLNNQENMEGIHLNWCTIKDTPWFSRQELIRPVFVLTRIPADVDKIKIDTTLGKIVGYLNEGIEPPNKKLGIGDISILHSDRELELKEELRIKPEGSIDKMLLSYEYLNLFGRIILEKQQQFIELGQLDSIAKTIVEMEESSEKRARLFALYIKEGVMVNPADDRRNVSFRVETIQKMFNSVYNGLKKMKGREDVDEAFFQGGVVCGESFGKELVNEVWKDELSLALKEKLDKWGEFDSEAGFGRFSNEVKTDSKGYVDGKIVLNNNFLAANRESSESNLCPFMTGYIQGVLEILTETKIKVTHKPKDCMQSQPDKKECIFCFRSVK